MKLAYSAFYGLSQAQIAGCGFSVRAMRADPDRIVRRHSHDGAHAIAILRGKYLSLASPDGPLGALDIVFNPDGVEHADTFEGTNGAFVALSFEPQQFPRLSGDPIRPMTLRQPKAIAAIAGIMGQITSQSGAIPEMVEANVLALINCATPPSPPRGNAIPPRWALAARERLQSAAVGISIVDLAQSEGLHPVSFSRAFRRYFGVPPSEFAMAARLTNAAQQLARSRQPIAQIGLRWGFFDQAHFTRLFRRRFGAAPAQFRKLIQS